MNPLFELYIIFCRIGLFTFGGGHAMIPMITEEVSKNSWMTASEITQLIAVSESTPGPFAVNIATFIGSTNYGLAGSIVATLGVVTPSFIIILLLASLFMSFSHNKLFRKIIKGVNPVIVGLILAAGLYILYGNVISIGDSSFTLDYAQIILFAGLFAFNALMGKKLHPIVLIIIAGGLGVLIYQFWTPPTFVLA